MNREEILKKSKAENKNNTISSIKTDQFNPTAKLALVLCIALDKKFKELFFLEEPGIWFDTIIFREISDMEINFYGKLPQSAL